MWRDDKNYVKRHVSSVKYKGGSSSFKNASDVKIDFFDVLFDLAEKMIKVTSSHVGLEGNGRFLMKLIEFSTFFHDLKEFLMFLGDFFE